VARDDEPIRKVIRKRIRVNRDGVQAVGDVNAVIAANVSRGGSSSVSSVSSTQRIVQRSSSRAEVRSDEEKKKSKDREAR
jgi:hypothetical protein